MTETRPARAYYNEFDPYAAQWLRNLIQAGLIADGEVDDRSIVDVRPADLDGFTQCHFFAGIAGWSLALRLAGWPDDRPVWTGSCPCQPFSVAGKRKGFADDRHLWPVWQGLIAERRPPVVFGEQVTSATEWLARVRGDLEALGYAVGCLPIEASSIGAPHKRDRYWFVAESDSARWPARDGNDPASRHGHSSATAGSPDAGLVANAHEHGPQGRLLHPERADQRVVGAGGLGDTAGDGEWRSGLPEEVDQPSLAAGGSGSAGDMADADQERCGWRGENPECEARDAARDEGRGPWARAVWLTGADGKARRVEPGIRLLAHGVPARVGKLRAYGNAIVPQVAAEFIGAFLDVDAAA